MRFPRQTHRNHRVFRVVGAALVLSLLAPALASAKQDDVPPRSGPAKETSEPVKGPSRGAGDAVARGSGKPGDASTSGKQTGNGNVGGKDAGSGATQTDPVSPGKTDQPGNRTGDKTSGKAGEQAADPNRSDARSQNGTGSQSGKGNAKGSGDEKTGDPETPRTYIVTFAPRVRPEEAGRAMVDAFNGNIRRAEQHEEKALRGERTRNERAKQQQSRGRGAYIRSFEKVLNAAVISVPPSAVPGLLRNPRVLSIEEDVDVLLEPVSVTETAATWGLDRIDQRTLPLSGTFSSPSTASNVTAYVVDTGIDASHPEFTGRVGAGFDALGGGTGDCNGHGTHVAGTIGGKTYGVAKDVRLVPVRVLGCDGSGSSSGVIAGLDWIAKNRPAGERAVVNMSLGGGASSSLDSAVASLVASGVSVVVAAGNSNVDACTSSPARVASALTVGASTSSDTRASYSNFGSCLDLFAPGSGITSAVPGGGTAIYSGTSMAAPHVAGIAAVVLSLESLSPSDLAARLTASGTVGVLGSVGTGSPNLLAFLPQDSGTSTPIASAPLQPPAPFAEARSKAAVVSWTLPSDGGSAITSQTVRVYTGSRLMATVRVDGVTTSVRVSRLKAGTEYAFTVQATNRVGSSPESSRSNPVRPLR